MAAAKKKPQTKLKAPKKKAPEPQTTLIPQAKVRELQAIAKKQAWLEAYAQCGKIHESSAMVGVSHVSYYAWTNPDYYEGKYYDEDFVQMLPMYQNIYLDSIRKEIDRRAIEGWEEPVFGSLGNGEGSGEIGRIRKYSDRLLELRAKMALPEAVALKPTLNVDNRNQNLNMGGQEASVKEVKKVFNPDEMTEEQLDAMQKLIDVSGPKLIEGEVVSEQKSNSKGN